jgi:hypothetical protein
MSVNSDNFSAASAIFCVPTRKLTFFGVARLLQVQVGVKVPGANQIVVAAVLDDLPVLRN